MAQLHGRVRGISHRRLTAYVACLCVGATVMAPSVVLADLEGAARGLLSPDAEVRRSSAEALRIADGTQIAEVRARLAALHRRRLDDPEAFAATVRRFRHAVGSRRADDVVDISRGVLPVLATDRSPPVADAAERILLLSGWCSRPSIDATEVAAEIAMTSPDVLIPELRRCLDGRAHDVVPALLLFRNHRHSGLRSHAKRRLGALGIATPGDAVQTEEPHTLAETLLAFGRVREMAAMRVVASFLNDDRLAVREAARISIASYGRHALWQLREAYERAAGEPPATTWDAATLLRQIVTRTDDLRSASAQRDIDAARAALMAGEVERACDAIESALRAMPPGERAAGVAPLAADIARRALAGNQPLRAARFADRAGWLAPNHPDASQWTALAAVARARLALTRGVLEIPTLRTARAAPMARPTADALLERLDASPDPARSRRRYLAAAGALLLGLAAYLAARAPRRRQLPRGPATTAHDAA